MHSTPSHAQTSFSGHFRGLLVPGSLLLAAAHARFALLDVMSRAPELAQRSTLRRLVERARDTAFGRAHHFERITDIDGFRAQVPLRAYAELAPFFERARRGEPDVSWPGRIPYFAMSSGTTGGNKYLPISFDSVRQQQRQGFDPIASYLRASGDRTLFAGKAILLSSTTSLDPRPDGGLEGDNTGIMARHIPRWAAAMHLPSPEVRALRSWDERVYRLAREALHADVRLIAGTPAWFPALFDAVLQAAHERGMHVSTILELWPNLKLLTGGGVRFPPYRSLIEQRLGGRVPYIDVYNATEGGIMGVQDRLDDPAMRLLPDAGVFYELVAADEIGRPDARRLAMWEVELDRPYALAVSTPGGLFAYEIGDCLRFVQRFPHRFLFEGRSAAFLNVCGEHVCQGELERAVTRACGEQAAPLVEFSVIPEVGISGTSAARHVFLIEHDGPACAPERFARQIDRELRAGNGDYAIQRDCDNRLLLPDVRLVPRGTFEAFMRSRGKLGGQHKVPRVLADPSLASSLRAAAAGFGSTSSARSAPSPAS